MPLSRGDGTAHLCKHFGSQSNVYHYLCAHLMVRASSIWPGWTLLTLANCARIHLCLGLVNKNISVVVVVMSGFDLWWTQLMSSIKFVEFARTMHRGVHLNKCRLDLMHNRGGIAVAFFYCTRQKVYRYPFDLSSDNKKCSHPKLAAACLCKTNQEKLLTKATPLHSSVCPSTVVTAFLEWNNYRGFPPTFNSLLATTQGLLCVSVW